MKFSNISNKVISVGKDIVLPGKDLEIDEQTANLPAIQSFVAMGYAKVTGKPKAAKEEPREDEAETEKKAAKAAAKAARAAKKAAKAEAAE